ncbi:DUF6975 family protein [Alterisphingorhabdus coralli]|uniref:Uncharacterized protein n=1 Tax=Alterisphingorhabdus coralli TaxID=3071408 RepID=A0AA97I066_9SPHN|nr:hypothetical protein [Parasphingorhabdus sp. SCSIO 66989]WOE74103.1 hypothetical protein RB602_09560 [Parasphingorhabdus sp. SCSIO 66989]
MDPSSRADLAALQQRIAERPAQLPDIVARLSTDVASFSGSDLADIAYYLGKLHGHHPGLFDHMSHRSIQDDNHDLIVDLAETFAAQRAMLANMTVEAGPATTLAGEYNAVKTIEQLRTAIDVLGQSDRQGCGMGAAIALLSDWIIWRPALNALATRLAIPVPDSEMQDMQKRLLASLENRAEPRELRAISFGLEQLYHQHDQFWLLLERRQKLRNTMLRSV